MTATVSLIREARAVLGKDLRVLGYRGTSSRNVLVHRWQRSLGGERNIQLYLQRDHRPWLIDWNGHAFTAGFTVEPPPPDFSSQLDGRFWFLFTNEERDAMREIHDAIVENLPAPTPSDDLLHSELEGILDLRRHLSGPWLPNHEVMFRYRTREDVRQWLIFIRDHLPALESRVLSRVA